MSEVQPETSFEPEARILLDDLKTAIEADMTQIKSALSHIAGQLMRTQSLSGVWSPKLLRNVRNGPRAHFPSADPRSALGRAGATRHSPGHK